FYYPDFSWIKQISPRIQKRLTTKLNGKTVSVNYQAVDIWKEAKYFLAPREKVTPNASLNTKVWLSEALYQKLNSKPLSFEYRSKEYRIDSYQQIASDGGLFVLEDIRDSWRRFPGQKKISYLLLDVSGASVERQTALENFLQKRYPGIAVESAEQIRQRASGVLKSFHLNLIILSGISVIIAFFLVSNTMSGIFLDRKREMGILRCLGATPLENVCLFLFQSVFLGIIATITGIALGLYISQFSFFSGESMTADIDQTISYSTIPPYLLWISLFLGVFGSFISAGVPALYSFHLKPISILRDVPQGSIRLRPIFLLFMGVVLLVLAYQVAELPNVSVPYYGLCAIAMVIIGQVLCFPWLLLSLTRSIHFVITKTSQQLLALRIGIEEVKGNYTKNSLTAATLMLSISLILSLSTLTDSYKASVLNWVDRDFPYDYSLVNKRDLYEKTAIGIPLWVKQKLEAHPAIEEVNVFVLNAKVISGKKVYTIHAFDTEKARLREKKLGLSGFPSLLAETDIMVSANLAHLSSLSIGDTLSIRTKLGMQSFHIRGIREDFFSESGTILMDVRNYRKFFNFTKYNSLRFFVKDTVERGEVEKEVLSWMPNSHWQLLQAQQLKELYLRQMAKVFEVLNSLKVTACLIAFLSLFSSILHNMYQKIRLLGVMRSIGGNLVQVGGVIFFESLFLISFGFIMGIMSSLLLNPIIIGVINKNAFGWTLPIEFSSSLLVFILISIIPIAFLVVLYPLVLLWRKPLRNLLNYE
ncbi:MAG: FtsX-like permease family protein, partial [Spirochaetota bacterium]